MKSNISITIFKVFVNHSQLTTDHSQNMIITFVQNSRKQKYE